MRTLLALQQRRQQQQQQDQDQEEMRWRHARSMQHLSEANMARAYSGSMEGLAAMGASMMLPSQSTTGLSMLGRHHQHSIDEEGQFNAESGLNGGAYGYDNHDEANAHAFSSGFSGSAAGAHGSVQRLSSLLDAMQPALDPVLDDESPAGDSNGPSDGTLSGSTEDVLHQQNMCWASDGLGFDPTALHAYH